MNKKYISRRVHGVIVIFQGGNRIPAGYYDGKSGVSTIVYHDPNGGKGPHYCDVNYLDGRTDRTFNPWRIVFTKEQLEEEKVEWLKSIGAEHAGDGIYLTENPKKTFRLKELMEKTLDALKSLYQDHT